MQVLEKLIMFHMAVNDMARSKDFYENSMGFRVTKDYGQGDKHWVSLELPGGGTSFNLTTAHENMQPGTMKLYISTSDIEEAHEQLSSKGATPIADDLYGPGSGVKWFSVDDPDGNHWLVVASR
jgi:catechol 2,3-dioxygenase-like lactoylglutathione lyase family enzyme